MRAMREPSMTDGGGDGYSVLCFGCRQPFDAFQAAWCGCLVSRRTLVCPSCLSCFCKAPKSYKEQFWEAAPKEFREAAAQSSTSKDLAENPDLSVIEHPLVLVVDDEKIILQIAVAAITALGYHAIVASDGEEGLAAAARYTPEMVLTDAFMPRLDGREMCRRIKANPRTAATKVVVMTSLYTASRYKYEAYKEFGADDYLVKPLDFPVLRDLLVKHLGASA
jgi:CheY-like chemotaxis protein